MRQRRTCLSWQGGFLAHNPTGLCENRGSQKASCCMFPCDPAPRIICNLLVSSLKYKTRWCFWWLLLGEAAGRKRWGSVCLAQGDLFRFYCAFGQSVWLFCQIYKGNGKQFSNSELIEPLISYLLICSEISWKFAVTRITQKSEKKPFLFSCVTDFHLKFLTRVRGCVSHKPSWKPSHPLMYHQAVSKHLLVKPFLLIARSWKGLLHHLL